MFLRCPEKPEVVTLTTSARHVLKTFSRRLGGQQIFAGIYLCQTR